MVVFIALSLGLIMLSMSLVLSANKELEKYTGPSRKIQDSTFNDDPEVEYAGNGIKNTYEPLFSN